MVEMDQIVFAWSEVEAQCPYIQYIISAINCGLCPNSTVDTTVTCMNVSESVNSSSTCLFAIQTETCGSILGEKSEYASADMFGEDSGMQLALFVIALSMHAYIHVQLLGLQTFYCNFTVTLLQMLL